MFSGYLKPYLPLEHGGGKMIALLLMPVAIALATMFFWPRNQAVAIGFVSLNVVLYLVFLAIICTQHGDLVALVRKYWKRNVLGYVARIHVCENQSIQTEIWSNSRHPLSVDAFSRKPETCECRRMGCWLFRVQLGGWRRTFNGFFLSGNGHGVIPEEAFSSGTGPRGTMDDWKFRTIRRRDRAFVRITDPNGWSRELEVQFVVKIFTALLFHFGSDIRSWEAVDSHLGFVAQWHRDAQGKMMRWSDELIGLLQEIDGTTRLVWSKEGGRVRSRLWEILSAFSDDPWIASHRQCPVKPARERRKRTPEYDPASPEITA